MDNQMKYEGRLLDVAHRHSSHHREEVVGSAICGCFHCLETFGSDEIEEWLPEGTGTAICPRCAVDSVLGDASSYPVTEPTFLRAMHERWFSVGS